MVLAVFGGSSARECADNSARVPACRQSPNDRADQHSGSRRLAAFPAPNCSSTVRVWRAIIRSSSVGTTRTVQAVRRYLTPAHQLRRYLL